MNNNPNKIPTKLDMQIETLEKLHTKAVLTSDKHLAEYAIRELQELYALKWMY